MDVKSLPTDTIAAIATASGRGGIGVVRISGPRAREIATAVVGVELPARRALFRTFRAASGDAIDVGVTLCFTAPHSYTGEDVVEFQAHGSPVVLELLVRRCQELGARLARPGEFTLRAFLNGKLDLAQAEAVADLIDANSTAAARSAIRSMSGAFSDEVHALEGEIRQLRAQAEAMIDFSDEDVEAVAEQTLARRVVVLARRTQELGQRGRRGSRLRRGLNVALAGRPNVGKSSLLNRLAREHRAIVTAIPGTTRDAIRESIEIGGVAVNVADTAGLRHTDDDVERHGIDQTWREIGRADLVLLVSDDRQGITPEDREIAAALPQWIPVVSVRNMIDITGRCAAVGRNSAGGMEIALSARTGEGIDLLESEILRIAGFEAPEENTVLARERHLAALAEAEARLISAADAGASLELMAEELRLAHLALGAITGEFVTDDLLGEIFSRFCIGK